MSDTGDGPLDTLIAPCVLVVDDDQAIRELLTDLLTTEGYVVEEASNGEEAVEAARRVRPAAVLIDLMMPVMSGAEATQRIKADPATAHIPVLAMSAGRNLTAVSLQIPADDFVPKPFDLAELLATLGRHTRPASMVPDAPR